MTYTWTVANLERNVSDGGVTVVHWRCTGVDGDNSASAYGTTSHTPDPSSGSFIAYDSITEEIAIGWAKAALDVDAIEAGIAAKINAMANPVSASGLPWVSEAE
jgi:hypothetical protein